MKKKWRRVFREAHCNDLCPRFKWGHVQSFARWVCNIYGANAREGDHLKFEYIRVFWWAPPFFASGTNLITDVHIKGLNLHDELRGFCIHYSLESSYPSTLFYSAWSPPDPFSCLERSSSHLSPLDVLSRFPVSQSLASISRISEKSRICSRLATRPTSEASSYIVNFRPKFIFTVRTHLGMTTWHLSPIVSVPLCRNTNSLIERHLFSLFRWS